MKRVNSIDVMRTNKMADFEDHVAIFSILFLPFLFLSLYSRLSQPLFFVMHTTQFSKVVLSNMKIVSSNFAWTSECSLSPSNDSSSSLSVSERPAMVWGNINVVTRRHIQKFATPNNISHADLDDSHILRKSQRTTPIRLLIRDRNLG